MSNKLYVGGLSWDTSEENLRQAFERFGEISEAKLIRDRDSGRSRGFGFITFASADDAARAIEEMNGTSLDGRNIRVDVATERQRGGGGGGGRRGGGPRGGGRRGGGGGGDRW